MPYTRPEKGIKLTNVFKTKSGWYAKKNLMVSNRLISNEGGMNTRTTVDMSQSWQQQQQSQPVPKKTMIRKSSTTTSTTWAALQ